MTSGVPKGSSSPSMFFNYITELSFILPFQCTSRMFGLNIWSYFFLNEEVQFD